MLSQPPGEEGGRLPRFQKAVLPPTTSDDVSNFGTAECAVSITYGGNDSTSHIGANLVTNCSSDGATDRHADIRSYILADCDADSSADADSKSIAELVSDTFPVHSADDSADFYSDFYSNLLADVVCDQVSSSAARLDGMVRMGWWRRPSHTDGLQPLTCTVPRIQIQLD